MCVQDVLDILMLNHEMRVERDTEGEVVADKRRPGSGRFVLQINTLICSLSVRRLPPPQGPLGYKFAHMSK